MSDITVDEATATMSADVTETNTGPTAAKDVVQIDEAPYGKRCEHGHHRAERYDGIELSDAYAQILYDARLEEGDAVHEDRIAGGHEQEPARHDPPAEERTSAIRSS